MRADGGPRRVWVGVRSVSAVSQPLCDDVIWSSHAPAPAPAPALCTLLCTCVSYITCMGKTSHNLAVCNGADACSLKWRPRHHIDSDKRVNHDG
jgi:hypothetical protein